MSTPVAQEKIHSELGASVASRWMPCPGSIRLSRQVPKPPTSDFAQEGTRAHAVAELSLSKNVDPGFFLGMALEGGEITEEMADFVTIFTDHCRELETLAGKENTWVERRFNLGLLNPPAPMFGTADFVAYISDSHTLHVVDLKYGAGVVVEVKGNKQLRYYALGAALSLDTAKYPIDVVTITIVQPRAGHPDGVIRSETISYLELIEFGAELMADAKATMDPNAPLVAGAHCRFCPASGVCPAQRANAVAVAQAEFDVVPVVLPPPPATLTMEQLADYLPRLNILEDWIKSVRAHALAATERGEMPGYKLVAKRATRKWSDEDGAATYLGGE